MNSTNQEIKNEDFSIDENIAYFIGVLHSDGCIYIFNDKKRNKKQIRLILGIGSKSIPMALKFKKILFDYFGRTVNLRKIPNRDAYAIQTSINSIWHIFENWDNMKIPKQIGKNKVIFSAYLAGLIDGDGNIKIKHNTKDRIIPQCIIRISNNRKLIKIKILIENHLNCKVHFEYKKGTKGVDTCFYISKKNIKFIEDYIYPHIVLPHKMERLEKFFKMKNEPARIRSSVLQETLQHP